jgi:thiamine kinase-like enzyme
MQKVMARDFESICRLNPKLNSKTITIKRLGGHTNRNFAVAHGKEKFFVRLPLETEDIVDRNIEGKNIVALTHAKKLAGILPRYYMYIIKKKNILALSRKDVFDAADGTMLTEYIEGEELNGKLLAKKEAQEALVKTLHAFHASGVKFYNHYDVFEDEIEKYRALAESYPIATMMSPEALSQMRDMIVVVKESFAKSKGISTHNDLEFENLLLGKDGVVYLLDFEYAGFNRRGGIYYDLGTLLGDNVFAKYPLTITIFEKIVELARKTYRQDFQREQILYGALADFLVMFWWAMARYFSAETQKEKQFLLEHATQGVRGMKKISRFLGK